MAKKKTSELEACNALNSAASTALPPETSSVDTAPERQRYMVDAAQGLNLRAGPGPSFGALRVLPDGALVAMLPLPPGAEVPGWVAVYSGGQCGWVNADFLRSVED